MSWSSIIGQSRVKSLLIRTLGSGQIGHAYLFYGPEGIGKDALAIEFAKAISCMRKGPEACDSCNNCRKISSLEHANVKFVFALPVGKNEKTGDDPINVLADAQIAEIREQIRRKASDPYHRIELAKANFIKINSIRDVKREASMSRVEEGKKIFIILNSEMMNAEASNSLLKTLEEPLPDTVLILTTSSKDRLLPTIVSRCQLVKCDLLQEEDVENALVARDGIDNSAAKHAARIANGSYIAARRYCSQEMVDRGNEVVQFLRLILGKNKSALLDAVDELASSADKNGIQQWLKSLQSWLRNALFLQQKSEIELLESEKQSLENFVKSFSNADLVAAILSVEKAIAHLDKNGYLHLVLTNLAIDLQKDITEVAS